MNVVIVEDELVAAQKLQRLIDQQAADFQVVAVLQSVEDSIEWFTRNAAPDLVFMDIHLADGSAFSIFEKIKLNCPIIFTTAYDEYALKAFEVNSVDYLLKPINEESLHRAISKYRSRSTVSNPADMLANILNAFSESKKVYKSNFLIPNKDKLIPLATNTIACIYTENKMVKIVTFDNQLYSMDSSLEEIYNQLDPSVFFRANRQYKVAHIKNLRPGIRNN